MYPISGNEVKQDNKYHCEDIDTVNLTHSSMY